MACWHLGLGPGRSVFSEDPFTHDNMSIPFRDLLFVFITLLLAMLALAMAIPTGDPKSSDGMEIKAEFAIMMEWRSGADHDVDIFCKNPIGEIVWFMNRSPASMGLDRDDLGKSNDEVAMYDGQNVVNQTNVETVTIRIPIPGEYVCTTLLYRATKDGKAENSLPVEVKATLFKLNPKTSIQTTSIVVLQAEREEKTLFRFTIDRERTVTNINTLPARMVGTEVKLP